MEEQNKSVFESFGDILNNLVNGDKYDQLPPKSSDFLDIPFLSDEELDALDQDDYGERKRNDIGKLKKLKTTFPIVEKQKRIKVEVPSVNELEELNVIGISGDNQRIITPSFHIILSRYAMVDFRYTLGFNKPYFYAKEKDTSSLLIIDANIFEDNHSIYTNNSLIKKGNRFAMLNAIKNFDGKPFRFKYSHDRIKSSPVAHSLGLGVKLQHTLELSAISDIDFYDKEKVVCIKDGPYLSNSVVPDDAKDGLKKLLSWSGKKRSFVAVSTKISDSRVLINTIKSKRENEYLLEEFFKDQGLTTSILDSFGTDILLLKKILLPGYRTPLIQYVEETRAPIFEKEEFQGLTPLTCYYHKYNRPYNFIRIEIPRFMWDEDREMAEFAIKVAIWQYELGGSKPLVLKAASERANLNHEKRIVEQQMKAEFERKNLSLIEFLNII